MKLSRRTLITGSIAIAFLLVVYWFSSHFKIVWEKTYVGYQGEAAYNSLLAAQRLLERLDVSTETVYFLPDTKHRLKANDTMVIRPNDTTFNPLQSKQLLTWIQGGGHLILEVGQFGDDPRDNLLLAPFKVQAQGDWKAKITTMSLKFKWQGQQFKVAFAKSRWFTTEKKPLKFLKSQKGYHLLHYRYGHGFISLFSDLDFATNAQIGKQDHAAFFWQLLQLKKSSGFVWLVSMRGLETPSLWGLLWEQAWTFVVSAIILLMVWLWHISGRFGPLLPPLPRARRRLLEHIEASGRFLWQRKQTDVLLQEPRQVVLKRLAQIHPNWLKLPREELVAQLAQRCHFTPEEVQMALYRYDISNEAYFTRAIQVLAAIKTALNAH